MNDPDFIPWLLAARTPSIRYLTLRRLLGRPEDDADVQAARREMAASGPIPAILARQTERGNWANERNYYSPKYTSTHWRMTLLAELAADPADERLRRGAEFMLADTEADAARAGHGWVCFWGNLLRYALYCGFGDDPRVARLTERVVRDATEAGWRCRYNDELPCAWGAARALWGLAARAGGTPLAGGHRGYRERPGLPAGRKPPPPGRLSDARQGPRDLEPRQLPALLPGRHPLRAARGSRARRARSSRREAGAGLAGRAGGRTDGTWRGTSPFRTPRGLWDQEETDRWVTLHAASVLDAAAVDFLKICWGCSWGRCCASP